jgi:CheY-like chemotaxis protein
MDQSVLLLLAEDEELIAEALTLALEDGGYSVLLAASGSAAIDALNEQIEQLAGLITDIRLPDGPDGWEIARHARELKPAIPVVYMSGDSAADWSAQGVPNSVVLQKPFASAQLVTAISALLTESDRHRI